MAETMINCPHCGKRFALSSAISNQIEEKLKDDYEHKLTQAKKQIDEEIGKREKEIEKKLSTRLEKQYEDEMKKAKSDAIKKAKKEIAEEIKEKEEELKSTEEKLEAYRKKEKSLAKRERDLDELKHTMEMELNEKLTKESKKIWEQAHEKIEVDYKLKLAEKEKTIHDLNEKMKEAQKKAEQGSMQLQGEVQEIELEDILKQAFPIDEITSVGTGKKGGDLIQTVRFQSGRIAGKIIWESKRTKGWSAGWIDKLKEDQRAINAEIAIIISEALPQGIKDFGLVDGVWVSDLKFAVKIALMFRESLKAVSQAQVASEGKSEKMELIYQYLTGTQFKQRIESILETYRDMRDDLEAEKRAIEKAWAKRDKQIERFIKNMAGMYGDLQGLGAALPGMKMLELSE